MLKIIPNTEGKYSATASGAIYRNAYISATGRQLQGKLLSQHINSNGYCTLANPINGTTKVHRLVAQAFLTSFDNILQVNHKDGDKQNNFLGNLEMVTCAENAKHAWRTGLQGFGKLHDYYKCDICGRSIRTMGGLTSHKKVHS